MNRKLAGFTLLAFALTLSISAFAGTKSDSITLYNDAQLNGKTLPAGDYTVKYNATGSTAQVKFIRNGKEVATADGQLKQLGTAPEFTQVVTEGANGTPSISEIDFAKSKTGVTFNSATMSSSNGE